MATLAETYKLLIDINRVVSRECDELSDGQTEFKKIKKIKFNVFDIYVLYDLILED